MPFPENQIPDTDFDLFQIIQLVLTPIFTIISFAFTVPLVLKRIVEEKEQGVKVSFLLTLQHYKRTFYRNSWKWWVFLAGCIGLAGSSSPYSPLPLPSLSWSWFLLSRISLQRLIRWFFSSHSSSTVYLSSVSILHNLPSSPIVSGNYIYKNLMRFI